MKEYVVCFSENVEDSVVKSRKIYAKSFEDAVAIVQKELIDEGKDPCIYYYAACYENEMYICCGVLK